MNLEITRNGEWHRFAMIQQDRWTPTTFFPQLDSIMARVREDLDKEKDPAVVFDLSALESIDSSMITIIVQTVRIAEGKKKVCVIAPNNDVYTWLSLLGIDRLADMFESEEQWELRQQDDPS
jgi:anti-anti-sigma regulatory factor